MMTIFIILLVIIIIFYMRFETTMLKKSELFFSRSSHGLRIAHLSDIHIDKLFVSSGKLTKALKKAQPDVIVMTGDYIEKPENIDKFIAFLKALTAEYPVYLSLGNHDHRALGPSEKMLLDFINTVQKTKARVILNSSECLNKNGKTYNLIGIDDLKQGKPDIDSAFKNIMPSCDTGSVNIAFSHNPDIVLSLPKEKVDYFLCGHFHGGQIWMPFHLEFKILRNEQLCRMGYRRGLHKINGIQVYINRGLGNVIFPFRFFSVPEIAVIQLP